VSLLTVRDLRVGIRTAAGVVQAVRGVDFALAAGETLALVGESGCGKSMTALALMGLTPPGATVSGEVTLEGQSLLPLSPARRNALRGARMGLVFQNPMGAFNPTMRVGDQIAEVLRSHRNLSAREAGARAVALLARMQVTRPAERARQYPFEFSGGMLQRAMVAMAVACEPPLLIADEPTTALDVTVQAEVLALLRELVEERRIGLLLITHDFGVVAEIADRVAVMYAGQLVEQGPVQAVFRAPAHPYTAGLQAALPRLEGPRQDTLTTIPGTPPSLLSPPPACGFVDRCPRAMSICAAQAPGWFDAGDAHRSRCWLWHAECPQDGQRGSRPRIGPADSEEVSGE
jgi:oligopeptide/dipeptide ABC transporter ATP-binding protein